jgi:hypothetical protein
MLDALAMPDADGSGYFIVICLEPFSPVIARLDRAIHMWTAPCLQEVAWRGSKRLRSYVRSVDAAAHDRCQDGFRNASSKQ